MLKTSLPINNFASGQIDRELKARYDIPLYQHGHEIAENFCETIKGTTFFRTGFKFINEIGDASLYEFKFNQEQSYLLVFRVQYIEFWSYDEDGEFVQVLDDDGEPLKVVHPYGTEAKNLCMTQNCDVMYITHLYGNYSERQLKRTASNKFELSETSFTNSGTASLSKDPTTNHGCPCTCSFYENRLDRCSSSKYYTYLYGSKGADYDNITIGTGKNDGFQFDLAESNSKALWLLSGANSLLVGTAEGVLTVNGGDVGSAITPTDISAKLSCHDGCGAVQPVRKDNYVFFVSANGRKLFMFEYDVLLEQFKATNLSKGNYEITKGGITKLVYKNDQYDFMYAVCDGNLLQICFSNDESVNAWSVLKTKGDFKDICTVTRPDGNYDLFAKVKRTVNGITRYYLEQLTDIVEFPRLEDYVSEIPDDATESEMLKIKENDENAFYRSVVEDLRKCNYLDCSIEYSGLHTSPITYDAENKQVNINIESTLENIYQGSYTSMALNNGIICIKLSDSITGMNGATTDYVGIFSKNIETDYSKIIKGANLYKIVNKEIYNGSYASYSANEKKYNNVWYHKLNLNTEATLLNGLLVTKSIYYTNYNNNQNVYAIIDGTSIPLYVGKFASISNTKFAIKADTLPITDNYYMGEITSTNSDTKSLNIGYYEGGFKSSDIGKRISFKSITGNEYGIFDIKKVISSTKVDVNILLEPPSNTFSEWYLSATVFSGLEHLEGETVSVVGNGGYIGDFIVNDGMIDISEANTNKVGSAIIGLKYKGMLKSPNLGMQLQTNQTYTSMKNIYSIILKLSFSAGGKVGDSLYSLEKVQDFNPEGLFDVPPLPMDSDKEVLVSGKSEKDKHYFVVQDEPLPFMVTMVVPKYTHIARD